VVADVGHARDDAAALLDDGDTRRRRRGRRGNVAVSERATLEFASGYVVEQTGIIVGPVIGYERGACAELAGNENISTQPCDVGQRILVDIACLKVLYGLEVGAPRSAESAWNRWNDQNAFGAVIAEDIISNVASIVDCVDTSAKLVGCQDLAAIGAEA
jgi:hypothetical protein